MLAAALVGAEEVPARLRHLLNVESGLNDGLALFAAGITVASAAPKMRRSFSHFGEIATELTKLAAIFVFGTVLSPSLLAAIPVAGYVFALIAIVVVRPVALAVALVGGGLTWREWATAAWFGPKGFSSVVYGLLILTSGLPGARDLAHLVAIVIAGSILAHSSTDVLVARWFRHSEREPAARRERLRA